MAAIVIFICRTLGAGWKVKKPLCLSLFGLHCDCSLSINTNHQRKWVDALWKGHEGVCGGQMSDSLMCFWVITSFSENPLDSNLPSAECRGFLRQGI